jgi:hypothetical protein
MEWSPGTDYKSAPGEITNLRQAKKRVLAICWDRFCHKSSVAIGGSFYFCKQWTEISCTKKLEANSRNSHHH